MEVTNIFPDWVIRNFMRRVIKQSDGHWRWDQKLGPSEYGRFSIRGRLYMAHRVSYLIFHGPIPEGYGVLHKVTCHRTWCVNPECLYAGTQLDNMADRQFVYRSEPRAVNARKRLRT